MDRTELDLYDLAQDVRTDTMNGEKRTFELQFCNTEDNQDITGSPTAGRDATEVRLWDAAYWQDDDPSQGTYPVGDQPLAVAVWEDDGYDSSADTWGSWTADYGDSGWYGWQGALKSVTVNHDDKAEIFRVIDSYS